MYKNNKKRFVKSFVFLLMWLLVYGNVIGQSEKLESNSAIREESEFKIEKVSRLIVFENDAITISNWLNGGKEALKLKIDKIVEKEDRFDGKTNWYYCTSLKKDPFNGFSKNIIIVPKARDKIRVYTFADEVTIYHTDIIISKY